MITFHSIQVKNFRSIGPEGITLQLDKNPLTLIVGENGTGKSTLPLHGITYVLYNKAYGENDKLSSLVNSTTKKECVAQVEFSTNGKRYKVTRGQKPTVFDIEFLEGDEYKRVDDTAHTGTYQKVLDNILNTDMKTLHSSVLLGLDNFIPFLSMNTGDRRAAVEQYLDITIFSEMNVEAKQILKDLKADEYQNTTRLSICENNVLNQERHILTLVGREEEKTRELNAQSTQLNEKRDLLIPQIDDLKIDSEKYASDIKELQGDLADGLKPLDDSMDIYKGEKDDIYKKVAQEKKTVNDKIGLMKKDARDEYNTAKSELTHEITDDKKNLRDDVAEQKCVIGSKFDSDKFTLTTTHDNAVSVIEENYKSKRGALISEIDEKTGVAKKAHDKTKELLQKFHIQIDSLKKDTTNISGFSVCPTCRQKVDDEYKQSIVESNTEKLNKLSNGVNKLSHLLHTHQNDLITIGIEKDEGVGSLNADRAQELFLIDESRKNSLFVIDTDYVFAIENIDTTTNAMIDILEKQYNEDIQDVENTYNDVVKRVDVECIKELAEIDEENTKALKYFDIVFEKTQKEIGALKDQFKIVVDEIIESKHNHDLILNTTSTELKSLTSQIDSITSQISDLKNLPNEDLEKENAELEGLRGLVIDTQERLVVLADEIDTAETALVMLKDGGIKQSIISKYIPMVNKMVNATLAEMDMFIGFKLGEDFKVELTSPDKKGLGIASLSNGLRRRVDIAILFAWREICSAKNTVDSNLLVFDEILDPISNDGLVDVIGMLKNRFIGKNVYITTQRGSDMAEHFDYGIMFEMGGDGFSKMQMVEE